MKLNYEEANDLYALLTEHYGKEMDDEIVFKLAGAINLIDECAVTEQDDTVIIKPREAEVLVSFNYNPCWPDFLIEQVESGSVKIDSAYNKFVTVEMVK